MKKIVILGCENSHADMFLGFMKGNENYADLQVAGVYSDDKTAAEKLAEKYGVSMPISEQCYDILYNGTPPMKAAAALMTRPERSEEETIDIK